MLFVKESSVPALLARGCTDFIRIRRQGDSKTGLHLRLHPRRHVEGELLHEGGEEEEQLHPSQSLSEAQSLT